MEIKRIQEIIKLVEKSTTISEFSIEEKGFKFFIKLHGGTVVSSELRPPPQVMLPYPSAPWPVAPPAPTPIAPPSAAPVDAAPKAAEKEVRHILSPIVGTFYNKPYSDAPVYVKVGDSITPKSVVCTIEAMKVFNEIEAEVSGKIKEILIKDGSPVEHGQPLFVIE